MDQLHSYDMSGPIGRVRTEKFWIDRDPIGLRRDFRYDFEVEVAETVEMNATTLVHVGKKLLKEGNTFNDYYGFGDCRNLAVEEASVTFAELEGAAVTVTVLVIAQTKLVIFDLGQEPFYCGAVRCFLVPGRGYWRSEEDADRDPDANTKTFEVWRNGEPGKDHAAFEAFVAEWRALDAAQDRRKPRQDGNREVR